MATRISLVFIGLLVTLLALIATGVGGVLSAFAGGGSSTPSPVARADIPGNYLVLYHGAAAECPGLDWSILAAIGNIESDHGRSRLPGVHSGENAAGAAGAMQELKSTFAAYDRPIPPGGATPPSIYDPADAVYAAARDLCASGAKNNKNLYGAIWNYNHADWYVQQVLTQAAKYRATDGDPTQPAPSGAAGTAIAFAENQIGKPYVWDGNGDPGFDCSGLTHAAYAAAGITIPRTAATQYLAGPRLPTGAPLKPGDLVFYGKPLFHIHHVGIYIGHGDMIDAPDFGLTVRIEPYRWRGDDFAGARRIAN